MAMMTWAAIDVGRVRTVGLCHGVQNGHRQISRALGVPMEEVDIICSGINHQTWYLDIRHKGVKVTRAELTAADLRRQHEAQPQPVGERDALFARDCRQQA